MSFALLDERPRYSFVSLEADKRSLLFSSVCLFSPIKEIVVAAAAVDVDNDASKIKSRFLFLESQADYSLQSQLRPSCASREINQTDRVRSHPHPNGLTQRKRPFT